MRKRVVITGLGAITALGEGTASLWQAALEGRSGIDFLDFGGSSESWKTPAAFIKNFTPEKFVTQRKALKVMARDIQLAVAGASLAMKEAGFESPVAEPERFGVIVGSGVLNHEPDELAASVQSSLDEKGCLDLLKFGDQGLSALFPLWLLKYLPNMPACHISILFDLQGMNNTVTTGASAGMQAVGEAFRIIERGDADVMLAGAAESKVNPVGLSQYKVLGALSDLAGADPQKSYRPFDAKASGFVVGEGSGFLVLEELEHAKKRKANIFAEVKGFGSSFQRGQKIAMEQALLDAGMSAGELQVVQACGLGLASEDNLEAEALTQIFNGSSSKVLVSASKPVMGFTGFSAGALDVILSAMMLKDQQVPPVINFSQGSKDWGFEVASLKSAKRKLNGVMTNAFGFNGQCASLVMKTYQE